MSTASTTDTLAETNAAEMEAAIDRVIEQIKEVRAQMTADDEAIARLKAESESLRTETAALRTENQAIKAETAALREETRALLARLHVAP